VEGFGMGPQAYYAAIWERAAGPAWKARHGLTVAEYQIESLQSMADGYRLAHLSAYNVGGVDYYAAIWEQAAGPAQVARIRETSEEFQHEVVDRSVQGYRLKRMSGYALANSAHYAGIWEAEADSLTGTYCEDQRCFDLRRFADHMEASLAGRVVKYGFEVRRGRSVIQRAGGPKRTAADPPASSFTAFDRFNPASVSKVVTAVATLQLLTKRGISLNAAVSPYLPPDWRIPANNRTITFREVLRHFSGLKDAVAGDYEYDDVRRVMETPIVMEDKAERDYQNVNYALLRVLAASLDGYSDWANNPGANTAARFISYVNKRIFSPLGIQDVEYRPEANGTFFYPFPAGSSHGTAYGDWSLKPGSAGSHLSAHELALFMAALFKGMLLSPTMLAELWDGSGLTEDGFGMLPDEHICRGKGGKFPGERNGGADLKSALFHCSNGVSGMLLINGTVAPGETIMDALNTAFSPAP